MKQADTIEVRILGCGSSGGVPRLDGDWGDCDPYEAKNHRSRCSILVTGRSSGTDAVTRVLIDTSPDLRAQFLSSGASHLDAVLFTHDHADQCHGIDDLRALAYRMKKLIPVYLDAPTHQSLTHRFAYCFEGRGGYPPILDARLALEPLEPITVEGAGGAIEFLPVDQEHGRIRSLGFRFGSFGYCNDVNILPEESLEALRGVDVFIVDALRYTPHPSHAHLELALEWIRRINPRQAYLTNLHIDMDYRTLLNELPSNVIPAFDGLTLTA
ncbi:MAG: phosphoribosyl 1,2-cyclic phosphodiesterase [Hirschia sp.]|nr:phosphoribosyl 1,2-cyclic phosphodiesterase [Hirschia sp.]MBF17920.1 phosphoribosyl 1,2-cyclic phosphodiesterase [Hirschia sp.]